VISVRGTSGLAGQFCPALPVRPGATGEPNIHKRSEYVAPQRASRSHTHILRGEGFDFSSTKVFDRQNNYHSVPADVPLKDTKGNVSACCNCSMPRMLKEQTSSPLTNTIVSSSSRSHRRQRSPLNNHLLIPAAAEEETRFENDLQTSRAAYPAELPADDDCPKSRLGGNWAALLPARARRRWTTS